MWKTVEGSTAQLIKFCIGYFLFYLIFQVATKYYTDYIPQTIAEVTDLKTFKSKMNMEFLIYSTIGGNLMCLLIVFIFKWYKLKSNYHTQITGIKVPVEFIYIIPSGICTAVIIPTTTLMFTLPITVMVAMVIMRGSIIVISRIVDAIQIAQGILKKKVYLQEELGVVFALMAVVVQLFYERAGSHFDFLAYPPAVIILSSYLVAYSIRLYFMNYFKNTRAKGIPQDNKGFFAIEQISAALTLLVAGIGLYFFGSSSVNQIDLFQQSFQNPTIYWKSEIAAGAVFGIVAFFSVFLFMFKGRTATFAGLVNRLTSLIGGTVSTLIVHFLLGGKFPSEKDWVSLLFILVAVGFLTVAEQKRTKELIASHDIELTPKKKIISPS